MSKYSIELKEKAIDLRKQGFSIKEIAQQLEIAQSTSSVWLQDIFLEETALKRLEARRLLGRYRAHKLGARNNF